MAFTLHLVDWRDEHGVSYPGYVPDDSTWKFVTGPHVWNDRSAAEAAAEAAWIEPDCNGVAPVFEVTEY